MLALKRYGATPGKEGMPLSLSSPLPVIHNFRRLIVAVIARPL